MIANRTILMLVFCLWWLAAGCSDDDDILVPANTVVITQDATGGSDTEGVFIIPAGTTVTSQSASAPGGLTFSVGKVPDNILNSFTGILLGSAAFLPLDCQFNQFVVVGIPVGDATGAFNIYRYEASAVSQTAGWQRLNTVNIRQGLAKYEAVAFGYYIAGRETNPDVVEPEIPDVPTNLQASDGTSSEYIQVTFDPVFGGTSYLISRDSQDNVVKTLYGVYSWNDSGITDLEEHTYWVRASNPAGTSDFSDSDTGFLAEHDQGTGGEQ
jgi:hypothetical protein